MTKGLEHAIRMEQDTCRFYRDASERVSDEQGRRLLKALAEEEENHEQYLLRGGSQKEGELPEAPLEKIRELFKEFLNQQASALYRNVGFKTILTEAMELEVQNRDYYLRQKALAADTCQKRVFEMLAEWEDLHVKVLQILTEYLDAPESLLKAAELLFHRRPTC